MDDLDDLDRKNLRTILGGEMVLDNFVKLGQTKVRQNIVGKKRKARGAGRRATAAAPPSSKASRRSEPSVP
jgi:hypothetical protein